MKISTRGRYGLLAIIDIALNQESGCVTLKSVAGRQGLSEHYLEQLVSPLKKAGLVRSIRGAQGGYVLNRSADEISMGDILRSLEKSLYPVDCLDDTDEKCACGVDNCSNCVTKPVWEQMYESFNSILDNTKLDKLVEDYKKAKNEMYK